MRDDDRPHHVAAGLPARVTLLALKLFLAPGFIVLASLIARRFGVRVAGIVAGLPVIAGPILLVLALDRGRDFAAHTAAGTTLGIVSLMAFVVTYAAVGRGRTWVAPLLAGWLAFGICTIALVPVHLGAILALVAACSACATALLVLPRPRRARASLSHPRWDLPFRAVCGAVPVLAVTALATRLGPHTSGLLAAFPIITPVLSAFTHAQAGPDEAVHLLRGFSAGFFAYALFCFTIAVALQPFGTAAAFALGAALALALQAVVVAVAYRREDGPQPEFVEG